jgi:hypothetical protein
MCVSERCLPSGVAAAEGRGLRIEHGKQPPPPKSAPPRMQHLQRQCASTCVCTPATTPAPTRPWSHTHCAGTAASVAGTVPGAVHCAFQRELLGPLQQWLLAYEVAQVRGRVVRVCVCAGGWGPGEVRRHCVLETAMRRRTAVSPTRPARRRAGGVLPGPLAANLACQAKLAWQAPAQPATSGRHMLSPPTAVTHLQAALPS